MRSRKPIDPHNSSDLSGLSEAQLKQLLYQKRPDVYAEAVLGVKLWAKQIELLLSIARNKFTMALASHGVGKSYAFGCACNWSFDAFPDSKTITSAPSQRQVERVLWGEIRKLRNGRPGLLPKAPKMEDPDPYKASFHWAEGFTAASGDGFQGVHANNLFIYFDEGVGIRKPYWDSGKSMASADNNRMGVIMNPTDITSEAYAQYRAGGWNVITISAMDHPNVIAELRGEPIPYPGAVSVGYIKDMILAETDPLAPNDSPLPTDFEFPPNSGIWYRPNGVFESRVLGRWPSQASTSIWSMLAWELASLRQIQEDDAPTEIGCDVARQGEDYTEMVVRRGRTCLHWERHNGWLETQVAGRLIELAHEWTRINDDGRERNEDPEGVAIKVDDSGVGGGVVSILMEQGYNVVPVIAQSKAFNEEKYPNRRSELWFDTVEMARMNRVDVSRLSEECLDLLQIQLFSQTWEQDSKGRRVAHQKKVIKAKLKRSPDTADAFNLAFAPSTIIDYNWETDTNLFSHGRVKTYTQKEADQVMQAIFEKMLRPPSIKRTSGRRSNPFASKW